MNIRASLQFLLATLLIAAGCSRSGSIHSADSLPKGEPTPLAPDTAVRVHWLGKNQLGIEASAYYLMRLWELPESRRLQWQTLDKLSVFPWMVAHPGTEPPPFLSALSRTLLDDVVQDGCYLEVRTSTDQHRDFVFAIRLNEQRSGVWRTNLVGLLASITGVETMTLQDEGRGWVVRKPGSPNLIELVRAGEWTVVGGGNDTNRLLGEIVTRIQQVGRPFVPATNHWLELILDRESLVEVLPETLPIPADLTRVSISLNGDGGNVLTRAAIHVGESSWGPPQNWVIPTNLIQGPLVSLTAVRGLGPLLTRLNAGTALGIGDPPDQCFIWSSENSPMEVHWAVPIDDHRQKIAAISQTFLQSVNPWLATNAAGAFAPISDDPTGGVVWQGLPVLSPFVRSAATARGGVLLGGTVLSQSMVTGSGPSTELLQELGGQTNLFYYDWEFTGRRIESTLYIGQVIRAALRKAQLPLDSAGADWLRVIMPRLGPTSTRVVRSNPEEILVTRKSTSGFTASELQVFVDWLESPHFPQGLYSTRAPAEAQATP